MRSLLLLFALFSTFTFAQTNATDAALDGYVMDEPGGRIAGASVSIRSMLTNQRFETKANDEGYFRFPLLQVGSYELIVAAPGFSEYRQSGIGLRVGQQARVNISLKVGSTSDSVTVQADAAMVESSGLAAQGEVLNSRAMRALPITSRNVYNLHLIGPGVKGIPSTGFGTTQFTFGGNNRSTWTVDGIDNTQRANARQIRLVISTPESVEEMQVLSGGYSAEFGRAAGGIINVVSRSGTNTYHGGFMYLNRPIAAAARPPLAATKPDQPWYQVAGNFSGALVKDRVWFFINDEFNPYKLPSPVTISPANATALGLPATDLGNSPFGETFHTPSAKMNFQLNPKNTGFIRYNRFTNDQPGGGGGLTTISRSTTFEDRMNGGAAQFTTMIKPNLLNEVRFGLNRRAVIRNTYVPAPANGALIDITGVANFGVNPLAGSEQVETSTQIIDNVSWTRGKHSIKTGFDYQSTQLLNRLPLTRTYNFGGLSAAGGRAAVTPLDQYLRTTRNETDPATGRLYTYTQLSQQFGERDIPLTFNYFNAFLQDEWRVRPNLTLNLGVRYELVLFPTLDDQAPYALSRKINNNNLNFAPRVGFSWAPFGGQRTVVRGGYGMYFDNPALNLAVTAASVNGRRILSYTIPGTDPNAPRFGDVLTNAASFRATPPDINAFPSDYRITYGHNANLQVEREIVKDVAMNVQYSFWGHRFSPYSRDINVGAPVRFLADGRPFYSGSANRPDARFRRILLIETGSNASYHAMDLSVRKRFSKGLQLSATWSWSHALSDSDLQGGALTDPSNRRLDYGNSGTDVRHSFNTQWLYAPRFDNAGLKWINGFELSSLLWYNSGYNVNAVAGTDVNNDLTVNDRLAGRARNSFRGPDFLQMDTRISRKFKLFEKYTAEAIAEAENMMNRLNPGCSIDGCTGAVVNRDGAADFGRITAARNGRQLQFGFRVSF
ncbi:MAG: TonB-dependent receptor [Acidobacteria bacterium]|nr:TonB-dependent receptor [Acidobacteriota bacterium]